MNEWNPALALSSCELVEPKEVEALGGANVHVVKDLLNWFPRRYEDRRCFDAFPVHVPGEAVCLRGMVVDSAKRRFGGRRQFYEIVVEGSGDSLLSTSRLTCRWFNMPYLHRMVAVGHEVVIYGKPKEQGSRMVIDHPEYQGFQLGDFGSCSMRFWVVSTLNGKRSPVPSLAIAPGERCCEMFTSLGNWKRLA